MKRRRTNTGDYVRVTSTKRPIDKGLVVVSQNISTTQQETDLVSATFPCTATGIRWDGDILSTASGGSAGYWAIVIVREGLSANTLSFTDGAALYEPEQDVLAYGHWTVTDLDAGTGDANMHFSGSTKSMRKLMGGDKLQFISKGSVTIGTINGCVQVFCKS